MSEHPIKKWIQDNDTTKNIAVTAAAALVGFMGHAIIEVPGLSKQVDQHTAQLQKLWDGQGKTQEAVQSVAIAVTRIDGKVDVITQKLDDARVSPGGRIVHDKPTPLASTNAPKTHEP